MRRLMLLCLFAALAGALPARAEEFRFPKAGKHYFQVAPLKGWTSTTDKSGGLLLVPPGQQHAMVYLGIFVEPNLFGMPERRIAAAIGQPAGVELGGRTERVRIANPDGRIVRGMAYFGDIPAKRGLARRAKIMVFHVASTTWAHVWSVTTPGINATESKQLDAVLNGITLVSEK